MIPLAQPICTSRLEVAGRALVISGVFPRVARLRSEYFQALEEPEEIFSYLRNGHSKADILTFVEQLGTSQPRRPYLMTPEEKAVLTITTYESWWKDQVNDKTRNMVRRAGKKGAMIESVAFDEKLIRGIKAIYDECPLRQGRPFAHYGKDLETLERDHATYLDKSEFLGAFYNGELIGFAKLVHLKGHSALMQIVGKNAHRDKAPTNGLIAKAVEVCASRNVPYLMYGTWSRGSLGDFKKHHGFEPMEIRRYFVPLNARGRVCLGLQLHRPLREIGLGWMPEKCVEFFSDLRSRWYSFRYRK